MEKKTVFTEYKESIIFPCIFSEISSFIFRLKIKIIFSGKNSFFPDNTKNIIFQQIYLEKMNFSEYLEKENIVFCAVNDHLTNFRPILRFFTR